MDSLIYNLFLNQSSRYLKQKRLQHHVFIENVIVSFFVKPGYVLQHEPKHCLKLIGLPWKMKLCPKKH